MYCIDSQFISLKTFGFSGVDNEILDLKTMRAGKIKTAELDKILTANFKTYIDASGGNVAFVRECSELDLIQEAFLKQLANAHQGISVSSVRIEPQNELPENFTEFKLREIFITSTQSSSGVFRALFELADFSTKSIYFKYSFDATMPVFIALTELKPKDMLSALNYQPSTIDFTRYDSGSLTRMPPARLIVRANIKRGEVLLKRHFAELSLIKKGDSLNAVISDGGLSIIISVTALQDGNLGETISVRTRDNKTYSATISSKKEAIIR